MRNFDLTKAASLLPHGSIAEISFNTRIVQSTVSRILQGNEMKGMDKVRDCVYQMLLKQKKEIESLLYTSHESIE